jgi:hypothetical protein
MKDALATRACHQPQWADTPQFLLHQICASAAVNNKPTSDRAVGYLKSVK